MVFVVGVTGGIGSGKTAATDQFSNRAVEVVDADVIGRSLTPAGSDTLTRIVAHFGPDILLPDGNLDRKALGARVFGHPESRQWLENLLHPLIRKEIIRQLQAAQSPYVVLSAPLLLETGLYKIADRILVIDADEDNQWSRTSRRDRIAEEQVRKIAGQQMSREQRLGMADDIITNNGSREELAEKIDLYHHQLLKEIS